LDVDYRLVWRFRGQGADVLPFGSPRSFTTSSGSSVEKSA
jgi:hypothetical protein